MPAYFPINEVKVLLVRNVLQHNTSFYLCISILCTLGPQLNGAFNYRKTFNFYCCCEFYFFSLDATVAFVVVVEATSECFCSQYFCWCTRSSNLSRLGSCPRREEKNIWYKLETNPGPKAVLAPATTTRPCILWYCCSQISSLRMKNNVFFKSLQGGGIKFLLFFLLSNHILGRDEFSFIRS